ncbi:MAG TPA: family 10 glycosylhydrolase [Clostridiales bacterium]|nr:family 10 glycosylhydrolase [Clostridiales bacterium]
MKIKKILAVTLILVIMLLFGLPGTVLAAEREIKVAAFTATAGADSQTRTAISEYFTRNDVYSGGQKLTVSFQTVTKQQILDGELENYDLIMIAADGGGAIANALGQDGCAAIEAYVAGGGGYFGMAGGAYLAPLGYTEPTSWLEIINLKVDYPAWSHGQGQLVVRPNSGTVITHGMQTGKKFIAYGLNPPALMPGDSENPKMGEVINVVTHLSNPTNNLAGMTGINMIGTPAVAAASYGNGRVVISGIQPDNKERQPVEMNNLLGQIVLYAAGIDSINVVSKASFSKPEIVGVWLWASTVYNMGPGSAEKIMSTYDEMDVTDIYLLVKGTNGTVYYNKEDPVDPSDAPKSYADRDILEEVITAAHAKGIKVHAWITSANDMAYKIAHPDEGRYHFSRGRTDSPTANYNISFLSSNFIEYSKKIVKEIANNYDIDGLHFDYIRYNHAANGWGPEDRDMLMKPAGGTGLDKGYGLTKEQYNELVVDLAKTFGYSIAKNSEGYYEYSTDPNGVDYLAFTADNETLFKAHADGKAGAAAFAQMRCDLVKNYASEVISAAKSVDPSLIISAALMPEGAYKGNFNVSTLDSNSFALVHYGQSYTDAADLYDYVCPMLYTTDYGASSQWLASLVKNAADAGNIVVAGLQAYSPADAAMLTQDINAVRAILSGNIKGIALFRSGLFNCVKTGVDADKNVMSVKLINARDDNYPLGYARISLQPGVSATEIIELSGGLEGATAEISSDGSSVTISNFNLPYGFNEGTIIFRYSGIVDMGQNATFTYSSADSSAADVRSYQITETMEYEGDPEPTAEPTATPEPTVQPTATPEPTVQPTATPASTAEPTAKPTDKPQTPKTGDAGVGLWIGVLVLSLIAIFILIRYRLLHKESQ